MSSESPRDRLLTALVEYAAAHGLADASLRELAAAVGTSHRMLLYHFGSREGVVAAVVSRVESDQRAVLAALAEEATSPSDLVRRQWALLSAPEMWPYLRLFFEASALALHGRPGTEGFLDSLTDTWLPVGLAAAERFGLELDVAEVRLGVALLRGLLLDAVASGDPSGPGEALERYLAVWESARSA
ncbi:TetR family transcriptional regulator [Nocardioides sp.]|uniref:TetR family transcriptional regulator n=1 Tax=Nocardioides sp. TaxID=35761 RepID=UPI0035297F2B